MPAQPVQLAQSTQPLPSTSASPAAPTGRVAGRGADLTVQLEEQTRFKQAGGLSEEEFQAAKAKLLGS